MAEAMTMTELGSADVGQNLGGDPAADLPPLKSFVKPWMYSPQIARTQQTTFNPMSTSQHYLARFGIAKHF